ncbi:RluA family pseudouridine synthase [bacterium]|nr:RluA family pseudouridine synthase [bacterium]
MQEEFKIIVIDESDEGERLDKFVRDNIPTDISRTYLQKLIKDGQVLVNSNQKKSNYLLRLNDEIKIIIPEPIEYKLEKANIPLNIVYEDEHLLVINKQAGIVMHPACGHFEGDTLVNALLYYCDNLSGINGVMRPGIVHRLDKDTSGLLVVAKNDKAHRSLAEQIKQRTLKRVYYTIASGFFPQEEMRLVTFIDRSASNRLMMKVTVSEGKEAISNFKVIERFHTHTLLQVSLETGRTHQIRVHLRYLGFPIVGDPLYGKNIKGYERVKDKILKIKRQALHSREMSFVHPQTGEQMSFTTDLPEDMKGVLEVLRKYDS